MKHSIFIVLRYCCLLVQSACAVLPYRASEQKPVAEKVKISDFVDPRFSSAEHVAQIEPYFESAEHKSIGDTVLLYYDKGNVNGRDFKYQAGSQTLSLGYIVALAGDFYANWKTFSTGCVEQVSDSWVSDEERSVKLFLTIADSLSSDRDGYLQCIIRTMVAQEKEVADAIAQGKDPAQVSFGVMRSKHEGELIRKVYKSISGYYDRKYSICTNLGYAWIALCNWDHFGIDAVHTYSAGHIAALRQATVANQSGSYLDLKQAYFLEGFALHYLTDLFSTGHMREARRILHKTYLNEPEQPDRPDMDLYPADLCARKQHDEDCANGLWVQNQLGDAWPAYGDKQLFTGKSARNFQQAVSAAQSGILEIWDTYKSGIIPHTESFEALKRIPILDGLNQPPNFVPLFEWNSSVPGSLLFRKDLSERNDSAVTALSTSMNFSQWNGILSQIKASPQDINMYPFSQSFTSTSNTVHFRQLPQSRMAINSYGPLEPGPIWNMQGQFVIPIPNHGDAIWVSMTRIGSNSRGDSVYSLVGSTLSPEIGPIRASHFGVSISKRTSKIERKWNDNFDDGNDFWTLVDAIHGTYSRDSSDIAMIKYWKNGPGGANKFELYSIPADFSAGPARVDLDWPTVPINDMFSYRIQSSDPSDMLVTLAFNPTKNQTMWNFTSWSNGYSKISTDSFSTMTAFPVQTILTGILGSDSQNASIVQLYYGNTFPIPNHIGVEVVQPSEDPSGKLRLPSPRSNQEFPITWPAHQSFEYLLWFLSDVNGDGLTDLFAYASSNSNTTLTVIVFPGRAGGDFAAPVSSEITLPASKGSLFTSSFMYPVHARQAAYTYSSRDNISTDAGILSFFDNYGILGARMIAPVNATGTFAYEFKGQTPAIAGQLSTGLGWRAQNLMGRGESSEAIGFANYR